MQYKFIEHLIKKRWGARLCKKSVCSAFRTVARPDFLPAGRQYHNRNFTGDGIALEDTAEFPSIYLGIMTSIKSVGVNFF